MTITGTTGGSGTRAIARNYHVVSGLTGGTQKQVYHTMNLLFSESNVPAREKKGIS